MIKEIGYILCFACVLIILSPFIILILVANLATTTDRLFPAFDEFISQISSKRIKQPP